MHNVRFIIVCQARTGSSMLSTALSQHPDICSHGEALNFRRDGNLEFAGLNYSHPGAIADYLVHERFRNPANFIDKYVLYAGKFKAVGFKFKYEELSDPRFLSAREYVHRNYDIKIIHMSRENIWRRFLSEYLALNVSGRFNSRDAPIVIPNISITIDPKIIEASFDKSFGWQEEYRKVFVNHDSIALTYEELQSDPNGKFKSVTEFLGVKDIDFNPGTKKIEVKQKDQEMIGNFDEIREYFKNSRYGNLFH